MLVYSSLCVCNLFTRAGNRGRWPASVKLVTYNQLIAIEILNKY